MFKEKSGVDLSKIVMARIEKEEIQMKSKLYFSVIRLAKKIGMFVLGILCIYLFSLVLFKISIYNPFGFLKFGSIGIHAFTLAFPFIFLVLALLAFLPLRVAVNQYSFMYKRSFTYATLNILLFVLAFGFFLDKTGLNTYFKNNGELPVIYSGHFVTEYGVMGKIIGINEKDKKMAVVTRNGEKVEVFWNEKTSFPIQSSFQINDNIQAIGYLKEPLLFEAQGIIPYTP